MSDKLIISDFYHGHLFGFQITDDVLRRIIDLEDSVVGNIYCGYVKDVVKNLNAAFVEFDCYKGFLSLKNNPDIKQGDKVLVQVLYDAIKSKDYGLSCRIELGGDFVVLSTADHAVHISKKIKDSVVRDSLMKMMKPYQSEEYGFILRTKCSDASESQIMSETGRLVEIWTEIKRQFEHSAPKQLLYGEKRVVAEAKEYQGKFDGEIVTDCEAVYKQLRNENIAVSRYDSDRTISIENLYKLGKYIDDAKQKTVLMKSGATLVIEPTEALTVIDVNTTKAGMKGNREETFVKINHEAADEISRQLEIRNISGIIVIDFINMKDKAEYEKLKKKLQISLENQSVPCTVVGFTKLGLMELSRKKTRKPFHEIIKQIDTER